MKNLVSHGHKSITLPSPESVEHFENEETGMVADITPHGVWGWVAESYHDAVGLVTYFSCEDREDLLTHLEMHHADCDRYQASLAAEGPYGNPHITPKDHACHC